MKELKNSDISWTSYKNGPFGSADASEASPTAPSPSAASSNVVAAAAAVVRLESFFLASVA